MLKQILLFKIKDTPDKSANAAELNIRLDALPAKISQIKGFEVGVNTGKSPRAWDVSLYSEFNNFDDLMIYQDHPAHQEVVKFVNEVCDDRHVVDYES